MTSGRDVIDISAPQRNCGVVTDLYPFLHPYLPNISYTELLLTIEFKRHGPGIFSTGGVRHKPFMFARAPEGKPCACNEVN